MLVSFLNKHYLVDAGYDKMDSAGPRLQPDPQTDRLRVRIADMGVIRPPHEPGSEANAKGDAKDHYLFIGDEINHRMRCNDQFAGLKLIHDAGAK